MQKADNPVKSAMMSLRLKPDVKAAAEKAAEADRRSVAAYVELVLEDHLRAAGYLKKETKR